jgi:hypothetical protein
LNSSQRSRRNPSSNPDSPQEKRLLRPGTPSDADSEDDDSWTDTGDLVDQLADQEDPLRIALADEVPPRSLKGGSSHKTSLKKKRVHYNPEEVDGENEKQTGVVRRKEDIPIPNPPPRKIPAGERLLVLIMARGDGPSRLHGLHGKKLM